MNRLSGWTFLCFGLLLLVAGCGQPIKQDMHGLHAHNKDQKCENKTPPAYKPSAAEAERDDIYMLVAYGVVYKDWQSDSWNNPKARGYNIGGVLVNPGNDLGKQLVCWSRNSVIKTRNGTQHGEVRLMTNYIGNNKSVTKVKGYKLYTSLEPCAMCSGMMTLQSLTTTIYGQTDPGYGKAIERLTLNSTRLTDGYCPYPRGVQSVPSPLSVRKEIDAAYAKAGGSITDWLTTKQAKALYTKAKKQLDNYKVQHPENKIVLAEAKSFIKKVPAKYQKIPYTKACYKNR